MGFCSKNFFTPSSKNFFSQKFGKILKKNFFFPKIWKNFEKNFFDKPRPKKFFDVSQSILSVQKSQIAILKAYMLISYGFYTQNVKI